MDHPAPPAATLRAGVRHACAPCPRLSLALSTGSDLRPVAHSLAQALLLETDPERPYPECGGLSGPATRQRRPRRLRDAWRCCWQERRPPARPCSASRSPAVREWPEARMHRWHGVGWDQCCRFAGELFSDERLKALQPADAGAGAAAHARGPGTVEATAGGASALALHQDGQYAGCFGPAAADVQPHRHCHRRDVDASCRAGRAKLRKNKPR